MTSPTVILAIPCLGVLVLLWTAWRCVIRRPRPSTAPVEIACAGAIFFALTAASSALSFSDRVTFTSSVRRGPLASFEWIPVGTMVAYLFAAGACSGAAFSLWFQRRQAKQQSEGN